MVDIVKRQLLSMISSKIEKPQRDDRCCETRPYNGCQFGFWSSSPIDTSGRWRSFKSFSYSFSHRRDSSVSFEVGDRVVLHEGGEVTLERRHPRGFFARWDDGGGDNIYLEDIKEQAQPRPEGIWEDLANRMASEQNPGDPAALVAAVKVSRKIQHLPTFGSINAIPFLFQYTPLFAFRRSPWGRILVADETGLGKTVEAGIILEELFRSNDPAEIIHEALIIGPKSLQKEWEAKLWNHFGKHVTPISSRELVARLTARKEPERRGDIYFLSMDSLRAVVDIKEPRKEPPKHKGEWVETKEFAGLTPDEHVRLENLFDLVVVDEAHHFKSQQSKRRKALGVLLGDRFLKDVEPGQPLPRLPKLIMLTATPLSTGLDNLLSYFRLMDPALDQIYGQDRKELAFAGEHHRVVLARRLANFVFRVFYEPDNAEALDRLRAFLAHPENVNVLQDLEDDEEARAAVSTIQEFAKSHRGFKEDLLAEALLELDPWADMVVRNTRRGVDLQTETRIEVHNILVELHPEEHLKAKKVPLWNMEPLAQVNYLQQIASSIHALVHKDAVHKLAGTQDQWDSHADEQLEGEDANEEILDDLLAFTDEGGKFQSQPIERAELLRLKDGKFEALIEAMKAFFGSKEQKGGLLFTRFTATGSYLSMRIRHETRPGGCFEGLRVEYIHGGIAPAKRNDLIQDLKTFDGKLLLILTEVGQEGIDLQFCTGVFHFDLPWNPMRLVQRNGRVHRIGQTSPAVFFYTFCVDESIDLRISQAIAGRMQLVYETFGDLPEGLFGGEPNQALKDLGLSGYELFQRMKGQKLSDLNIQQEIRGDIARWDRDTTKIRLHAEQIQKVLSDESEACQAWRPLVEDALHGSFGSLERVLREDVEALLRWSTRERRDLSAKPIDLATGLWDVKWNQFPFTVDTGALGQAARYELKKISGMEAQVLANDGKNRAPGLRPHQVLHLAHPLVAQLAALAIKGFPRPMLLAASGEADSLCSLICLDFEVQDLLHVRRDSRWFLLKPAVEHRNAVGQPPWERIHQRGSALRTKAIFNDLHTWEPLPEDAIQRALEGFQAGLARLHEEIRDEELSRRTRFGVKRALRQLRQLQKVLDYWEGERDVNQSQVTRFEQIVDNAESGRAYLSHEDLDAYRRAWSTGKGKLTKASKRLEELCQRADLLKNEIRELRAQGPLGIRVRVFDKDPHAIVFVQPWEQR